MSRHAVVLAALILVASVVVTVAAAITITNEPRKLAASKNEISIETLELIGTLSSKHNISACYARVPVKLQRRQNGRWVQIGAKRTDGAGKFTFTIRQRTKRHRFVAPKITVGKGSNQVVCGSATLGFDKGYLSPG
jgi:hypothetical protein